MPDLNPNHIQWVYEGILARSGRPCYCDETPSLNAITQWMAQVSNMRIKTLICLLSDDELRDYYGEQNIDLLGLYRHSGFIVNHIPATDYTNPPLMNHHLLSLTIALQQSPRPWLIHCSAGIDRTGAAIEFIRNNPGLLR